MHIILDHFSNLLKISGQNLNFFEFFYPHWLNILICPIHGLYENHSRSIFKGILNFFQIFEVVVSHPTTNQICYVARLQCLMAMFFTNNSFFFFLSITTPGRTLRPWSTTPERSSTLFKFKF